MLRSIDTHQFNEIKAVAELEPFGEDRMDIRFAILASVVAGVAGAKGVDGKPYTAEHFLRAIRFDPDPQPVAEVKQTIEQQTMMLNAWMDGANKVYAESKGHKR